MSRNIRPLPKINAAIADVYGAGAIIMHRDPKGYYYFHGSHPQAHNIESLYWYRVDVSETATILQHIREELDRNA